MRSRAGLLLVATALLGVAALIVGRAFDERPFQQRDGVFIAHPVAVLSVGHTACQGPIGLADDTSAVTFNPGTPHAVPGPRIDTTVTDHYSGAVLAHGRVAAGYDPRRAQTVEFTPPVKANSQVDICFRDAGPGMIHLYGDTRQGDVHPSLSSSVASIDGRTLPNDDISMVFPRRHPKSVLALVPEMFERASLFRPGFVGPWLYWLLAGLLILGAPLLLARALTGATDEEDGDESSAGPAAAEYEVVDPALHDGR